MDPVEKKKPAIITVPYSSAGTLNLTNDCAYFNWLWMVSIIVRTPYNILYKLFTVPLFQDPHFRAHRQKQRFIERLKHMRQNFATRKQLKEREQEEKAGGPHPPIVGLTSSYSLHDFHNFSVQVLYTTASSG